MRFVFTISFLFVYSILLNGQFAEPKFGKVELSDLSMQKYDKDTTAGALMLFDNGTSEFILNRDVKFQFVFTRHYQLKIFKKSEFEAGNVSIRLSKGNFGKEDLTGLKAVTYNLVDGKMVKTKLDNDNIYKAETKNYTDVNFAFPEIKEGSVIELAYTITSDFLYNFRGWTFQYDYPARWSQYSYQIPEYFQYREASKGYLQFDVLKKDRGNVTFTIPVIQDESDRLVERHVGGQSQIIKATTDKETFATSNVPAFISEPDIDCEDNYIQSIEFELSSVEYPGSMRKDFTQSWESVNTQMKDDEDFGKLLNNGGFVKDTVAALCMNKTSELEKAMSIYNYVQSKMKWNGEDHIWASKGLKKPFAESVGSSSEINLLLTLMLQTAGLKANPVMYSTRDNGIAATYYPTISKFNSVLTSVVIGGKVVLLDPASKYCPFGVLPTNDINGQGRVVDNSSGDWVNLSAIEKYRESKNYNLDINPDGKLTGKITGLYDGYAGVVYRNSLNSEKTTDDYFRKVQENLKGLTINKYSISDRYNNSKPLSDTLLVEVNEQTEAIGDRILFKPLLYEMTVKNRYSLEDRKYPVDYNYPISEVYTFTYTLPAGYKVESLPLSASYKLPDNSITFSYTAKSSENKIIVEYKRDVNKILFLPEDYKKLKDLYDQMVKKNAEQIIIKKSV